jgi:antitoxin component of RelBE/YafQ-DinJ toxin-antitoxin module
MWHNASMKIRKDQEIKARVDGRTKAELWEIAYRRGLDVSDLIREAVRDFIRKNQPFLAR